MTRVSQPSDGSAASRITTGKVRFSLSLDSVTDGGLRRHREFIGNSEAAKSFRMLWHVEARSFWRLAAPDTDPGF